MRRARPRKLPPDIIVNGWCLEKRPNSFAERYVYELTSWGADGYLTARHGFQTKRRACAFALSHPAPSTLADAISLASK